MAKQKNPPVMIETNDEVVAVTVKPGIRAPFRVRVFQRRGCTPVVLVSWVNHEFPPMMASSKIATVVWRDCFRYDADARSMRYFEINPVGEEGNFVIVGVLFHWLGEGEPRSLAREQRMVPVTKTVVRATLDDLYYALGHKIAL